VKNLKMKKRSLFDDNGKVQISKFDPDLIKLDPKRVKEIGERNTSLEEAEIITQEVLQVEFSI
jgi:hypothetical protein